MKKAGIGIKRRKSVKVGEDLIKTSVLLPERGMPLLLEPTTEGVSIHAWLRENSSKLEGWLQKHAAVLFRGFDTKDPAAFRELVTSMDCDPLPYKEQSSPRHQSGGKNVYTSTDYPPQYSIFLHNENSYQAAWPMKLFFYCDVVPGEGGATPIADCRRIFSKIPKDIVEKFERLGIMYMRNYSESMGLPWQRVFQTDDREVVEAHCARSGLSVEWKDNGELRTRAVRGLYTKHPKTGERVWFNHATFFHLSTRDADVRAALELLPEEDLPSQSYYGDGSPIELEVLDTLRKIYLEEEVSFPWQQGDVLLIDNMLCAHGRAPYGGERRILVAMADPMSPDQLPA